ncbi:nucleolar protein 14 [Colossoma macropomum]|uniref:nucleolar protein 14 n=1 Tax=Colossoma macropomum TaxID=42526 RepID=UPI001863BCB5|nr:nucleolar protein 14 [Colossoma macropomum]
MGKPPKKKSLADKVRKTKTSSQIKNNPFEVKINRKKFDVLGRKSKHDVGLPGVSRSKAINKRKDTLLKEFRLKNKANKFVDRRFGEYDTKMAPEDKILQRFALERQRTQAKKDIYNLNEEEELTHYGQSLAEIEKLTDVVDSDSDSDEKGLLSAELTASNFGGGGGLLRKKKPGENDEDESQKPKSRQELIEELILRSKQEKRERQTQKEEAQELTEKLDQEWKSIQSLLVHKTPKAERKEEPEKPKLDEYDVMVRELGFEMKAQPSEKLKTPEELAREERERLQKLEADRLKRMLGDVEENSTQKQSHLSADDLNDGFILDSDDRKTLSYQDGKWNVDGGEEEGQEDEEGEEGAGEEEEEEDEDEEGEDDGSGVDDGDDEDDDDDDEDEGEGGHSDLDSDQASGAEDEDEEGDEGEEEAAKAKPGLSEEERRAVQEAAKAELPYTFAAPESFGELKALLDGHSAEKQCIIVERIQKCNHPSLAAGNKAKLEKLFGFLLEYVGELAMRTPPELTTVNTLIPQVYALCQLFPAAASKVMQSLLSDSAHSMEESIEVKGRAAFPGLDMLIYLKIVALLFPTSDFRHPVTTPAFVYISQALTKCPVTSLESVSAGLVLCCLAVEFVSLSQRFFPELINFLLGLLHLAVPADTCTGYWVVPPFKQQGKASKLLLLSDAEASKSWSRKAIPLTSVHRVTASTDLEKDHYRLSVLHTCLDLVKRCTLLYRDLPSFDQIFQPIRTLLAKHLPVQSYPSSLQELHREILEAVPETSSQHAPLVFDKKKPIPLKLLEPKIVQVLDYGKKRGNTKEEREQERLKHKYKKEFKGALRELRKDTRFLAQAKLSDIMSRDAERKRKVKELYGSLATQEGEWKALKKKKRK